MEQTAIFSYKDYDEFVSQFLDRGIKKIIVVCDSSFKKLSVGKYIIDFFAANNIGIVFFSDYQPNPDYKSVVKGVDVFRKTECDSILAVGGGSTMDVAKCIKLYATMPLGSDYINQKIEPNNIPFFAIPTTAGTGSEATRFAVIYYNGAKQSIADYSCIPQVVLFDPSVLETLPDYQRKVTMLDAFCHAVEAFWSVNSTDESKAYSKDAIRLILNNMDSYLKNEYDGNKNMLMAANIAGKAINITQTTAGHAMCYKLTSLYGIAHGHAAALCVSELWPYMIENTVKCIDSRGREYLDSVFVEIAESMGEKSPMDAAAKFKNIVESLGLKAPEIKSESDFDVLKKSVNPTRLKNNPVLLEEDTIDMLYHKISKLK
ncbi:MAG: phosphonoacetaldehyde reductase [Salinivirgaceae bacterium]|nr:phosphonoacetaldehyde reductase [Salinivirgaceae bacterium]